MSAEHRWVACHTCMYSVVICGRCGYSTCSGGSGCADGCAEANLISNHADPPDDVVTEARMLRAGWERMTDDERDASLHRSSDLALRRTS